MHSQPTISCSQITKSYTLDPRTGSTLEVLKGIDLEVRAGEIISIVGASGSGKSTFLHILGGLDQPTKGSVCWEGREIGIMGDDTLSRLRGTTVGFVFQFHHLLPEFTARENVMLPLMIQGIAREDAGRSASKLLKRVGLEARENHKPGELSGGEQQRVAVARALANSPRIILADEPSGNLDSATSRQLHELIWELNTTERQTFVIVTHNDDFAHQSNRTYRMLDGKLQDLGKL